MLAFIAQELPGQKPAEDALSNLAGQGILGSLCVLLGIALFFSIRALLKAKDDRFTDQKMMSEALQKLNEAAKDLALEMNRGASNLVIESTRTNDQVRTVLGSQERSFDDMSREFTQLRIQAANFKCGSRS